MTNVFDDREKAFEAHYRLDQETQFKVKVRRNKLLGLWAAEQIGLTSAEADAYARTVVESDFEEPGDDDIVRKVVGDLRARNIATDEERIHKQLHKLAAVAREQVLGEMGKKG